MDPAAILARVLDEPRVARVMSVLDLYGRAAGGLLANGLAFSALFAAIPTALFVLGLAGWITSNPNVQVQLGAALVAAFPPLKDLIDGALEALRSGAALTSLIGALGVIWTVSQLYGALDVAFARIFADQPERDIIRRTARGFLLVGIIGFLIVALIAIVGLAALFDSVDGLDIPLGSAVSALVSSIPFLMALSVAAMVLIYRAPATEAAALAPAHRARGHRGHRDRDPEPGLHVPGAAPGRRGGAGGFDRIGLRGPGLVVVHLPGAPVRRRLGPCPRGAGGAARVSPLAGPRSAGRNERWRRVTDRS